MRVSYSPGYVVSLPEGHRFPMGKFPALHGILLDEGLVRHDDVIEPEEADWNDLALVHSPEYLSHLANGTLSRLAERRLGLPWSQPLVRRSRLAVQGTINAAWMAMEDGIAANLAGGTHHAFVDHGEGFCVLNDVAVAIRVLQRSGRIRRALIIDLDVHQGNGTATIFASDESVYTFSIHGAKNYPFQRPASSRDVNLPDATDDAAYLETLDAHLPDVFVEARPDVVFYLAGVDPVTGDRFGRLALTREGIHARERRVLETTRHYGVPLTLTLAGGYAKTPEATADLHAIVHREAARVLG